MIKQFLLFHFLGIKPLTGLNGACAGNIVVDGVAASVYNTAMGGEGRMHAFTAAGRALWRGFPSLLKAAHRMRIAEPISLAIGRFFIKVRISFLKKTRSD